MRLAVLSDVHANIHALEPVLEQIETSDFDRVICLGDVVGYGAFPNEVVEFLDASGVEMLRGAYDEAIVVGRPRRIPELDTDLERVEKVSYLWTLRELSPENRTLLRGLPREMTVPSRVGPGLLATHRLPGVVSGLAVAVPADWGLREVAERVGCCLFLCGHTHVPVDRSLNGFRLVNCGSVGMPHDGDTRACYVAIEIDSNPHPDSVQVTVKRVKYDVESAARAIERRGLPSQLAEVLRSGKTEVKTPA
jgi:predicted phosphodiesterase